MIKNNEEMFKFGQAIDYRLGNAFQNDVTVTKENLETEIKMAQDVYADKFNECNRYITHVQSVLKNL